MTHHIKVCCTCMQHALDPLSPSILIDCEDKVMAAFDSWMFATRIRYCPFCGEEIEVVVD